MSEWSASTIQDDFDAIARYDQAQGWNHNNHYHDYLLRQIPKPCQYALDIGCGTGEFARRLSQCANHVLALDLSPEMIRLAQERSQHRSTIEYQVANVLEYPLLVNHFDFNSTEQTIYSVEESIPHWLRLLLAVVSQNFQVADKLIWQGTFHGRFADRAYAIEVFQQHIEEVKQVVPAERLLVYDVQEGWEPLCRFLGVPVPEGKPFPT